MASLVDRSAPRLDILDILENIGDAVAAFDHEWRFTYVNKPAEVLSRLPREQLLGHVVWEVFPRLPGTVLHETWQRAMHERTHQRWMDYYQPYDAWIEADVWSTAGGAVMLVRDVSVAARDGAHPGRLERDPSRRIKEFETLLDLIPVGIAIAGDPDCRHIRVNPAMAALLGTDPARNASKTADPQLPFRLLRDGVEIPPTELPLQMVARDACEIDELELDIERSDGSVATELCFARPLFDERQQVRGSLGVFIDITERKRAEQALRESEARYRFLADAMPQIVWMATPDNQVTYINGHGSAYIGLTPEQIAEGGWLTSIHPDDTAKVFAQVQAGRSDSGQYEIEYRLRRASDGSYRWHFARASIVRMEDGSERWLGTAVDIDDRKRIEEERAELLAREQILRRQAEEALEVQRQIEARLLLLLEASSALIASPEPEQVLSTILSLSRRFVEADAYAVWRHAPDGISWQIIASEGLSDAYTNTLTDQIGGMKTASKGPVAIEDVEQSPLLGHRLDLYRAEGIRAMLLVPLRIQGQVEGSIVFYYRIPHRFTELETGVAGGLANLAAAALGMSELHQRQTALRKLAESAEHRAEFLSEAGRVLSSSLDYEDTLSGVAEMAVPAIADWAAVDILQPSGDLRRVAAKHIDPEKIALAHEYNRRYPADETSAVFQALRTGKSAFVEEITPTELEERIQDPEQLRVLRELGLNSVIVVPLLSNGRTLGALTFVAAQNRRFTRSDLLLAEELASRAATAVANAHLYRASKETEDALQRANSDLNQFTYSASHDLREPLRMVSIFSQMLSRNCADLLDADARQYILYISQGASRMEELLKDILDYTQSANISGEVVTGASAADALTEALSHLDLVIREAGAVVHSGPLPRLKVQPMHLVQIFGNLIGNAVKYRSERVPAIDISAERRGGNWLLSVRDNGIGIAPEYLDQIFGLFKRLHTADQYPGTGIGLAICQKVIERYGGRIRVDSEPGKGSVFSFTLPADDSK